MKTMFPRPPLLFYGVLAALLLLLSSEALLLLLPSLLRLRLLRLVRLLPLLPTLHPGLALLRTTLQHHLLVCQRVAPEGHHCTK